MAERPQDKAKRLRKEALSQAARARRVALDDAKQIRREALARGKEMRKQAMAQANEAVSRAFEPLTPQRRREMTREHLLEAAALVFARDGFHRASLDDIAALAGFTKGAVYSNFKSKEDLLLACMDQRIARQFDQIAGSLDTEHRTQEEQLPRIADTVVQHMWDDNWTMLWLEFVLFAARNPEAREKLVSLTRKSREQIEELIRKEYANTGIEPKHAPEEVAVISTAMFEGLGMFHLIDPEIASNRTVETLLHLMYDAMGVDDA
jgi:AcrR family transcriptional regulator